MFILVIWRNELQVCILNTYQAGREESGPDVVRSQREMRKSKKDWIQHERKTRITAETGNGKKKKKKLALVSYWEGGDLKKFSFFKHYKFQEAEYIFLPLALTFPPMIS